MTNELLSLALCRRLRDAGMPQDGFPQMVWILLEGGPRAVYWYERSDSDPEHVAIPPIIDASGKGGVLIWLEDHGFIIWRGTNRRWLGQSKPNVFVNADTPASLVSECLDAIESARPRGSAS